MMSHDGIAQFRNFIGSLGFEPPERIEPGQFVRFSANGKPSNTSASAKLFPDLEGGIVWNWATGEEWLWQSKREGPRSPEEQRAYRERCEKAKRDAQDVRARELKETAERAERIWRESKPADDSHPYLKAKGVCAHGLRVYRGALALREMRCDGALIVPRRSIAGDLVSLQFIAPSGEKRYLHGPATSGAYFPIGKPDGTLCIAEGFATAASIHEATGYATAVTFDAANLESTAVALRSKFPALRLIVASDDDWKGQRNGAAYNPGLEHATSAARAARALIAIPVFGEDRGDTATDFNDMAQQLGADAVRAAIERAMPAEDAVTAPENRCDAAPFNPPAVDDDTPRAIVRRLSDVEAKPVRWLWRGRIARGKPTVIAGNPGLGKSQLTCFIAATVTTGRAWPVDGTRSERGSVVLLSAEDDAEDTIRPRLEAAGADLSRVYILDAIADGYTAEGMEVRRGFNLRTDLQRLAEVLTSIGDAALVIVDPISAYLGDANSHNNAEVRALLAPLSDVAARFGVAVVAVSHLNKGGSNDALMRVTGSLAFVAAARAAFVVAQDKENADRRLFLPLKNNLARDGGGLAFAIESTTIGARAGAIQSSRIVWESEAVSITADEAMAPTLGAEERSELDDAKAFLADLLTAGPMPSKRVRTEADGAGHSWATIRRAQQALRIEPVKEGMSGPWVWRLPPKMLTKTEDAQPENVSTFAKNEHLRAESGDMERF